MHPPATAAIAAQSIHLTIIHFNRSKENFHRPVRIAGLDSAPRAANLPPWHMFLGSAAPMRAWGA
jgi:hypothetical protein